MKSTEPVEPPIPAVTTAMALSAIVRSSLAIVTAPVNVTVPLSSVNRQIAIAITLVKPIVIVVLAKVMFAPAPVLNHQYLPTSLSLIVLVTAASSV